MGKVPATTGMSASLIRTRYVEIEGREAIWGSQRRRKVSRAIGGPGKMAKASDTLGDEAATMAQRAAHMATRNESTRDH